MGGRRSASKKAVEDFGTEKREDFGDSRKKGGSL